MASQTIVLYRGNDRTVQITVKKSDATAYDLTGCTIKMYVKKKPTDLDAEAIITKTGTLTDAANGVAEFYLVPADTNDATELKDNTPYPVDFEVTTAAGKAYTVLRTSFVILTK
jgi:hypothetical protein